MAEVMGAEAALVRIQLVSGTHAISSALFSVLRPGDELLAVAGRCSPNSHSYTLCSAPPNSFLFTFAIVGKMRGTILGRVLALGQGFEGVCKPGARLVAGMEDSHLCRKSCLT